MPTTRLDVPRGPLAVLDIPAVGTPLRHTAVLVPGYTGSKEDFALILPALAAAGHRVLAYDQRGQYQSPGPDEPSAYTVENLAGDLLGVVERTEDVPVHLLGHSFGGLVARAAVLARPAAFASLTLLGSGPAGLSGPRVARMDRLALVLEAGGMPALWQALTDLEARTPGRAQPKPELAAFLERRFLASAPAGLVGMGAALQSEPDRVDGLVATGLPVLVAYGIDDDAWTPAVQVEMADRLGARREVIATAGHSPAAERPMATAAVLRDFWASVEDGAAR